MGQYYKPVLLDRDERITAWFYSHDYGNGLKLMEHSYVGNDFVGAVLSRMKDAPAKLVWAGDYSDPVLGDKNYYELASESDSLKVLAAAKHKWKDLKYAINHTKQLWVSLRCCTKDKHGCKICPVPLLTAAGNGRGGGEYHGNKEDLVGSWSGDLIEIVSFKPNHGREIRPRFAEMLY